MTRRRERRGVIGVTALLALLVSVLLGAWFVSGWREVRLRQSELRAAPVAAATSRAGELAGMLRADLDALLAREGRRPYFHYQNLMHDPRASANSVAPSPLARAPEDKLVLGYFQIDAHLRTTTPTVNDEVPALSDPENLAANRSFRDQVARDLTQVLAREEPAATNSAPVSYDASSYAANTAANRYYTLTPTEAQGTDPVTVMVSSLAWRTMALSGQPVLLATRAVQTPDGRLVQGFVVDGATVTSRLAAAAGELVAEVHADVGAPGISFAPGWTLSVSANPRALSRAATEAHAIARAFVVRFVVVAVLAATVAALIVLVVVRAERLARERSQFAAAAAHELRTPLAGMQLYGDMLADGLGDATKQRDYARRMAEEAARLGRVVSNVLGFSQLERGNLSIDPQVASVGEALCDLAERAQPALDRAGAVLEVDVDRDLRARFDRDALARIVGNLLDNAEKYARSAEDRTITLAARDRGDTVEVTVRDRGPGISDPDRLFRAFARGVDPDGPAGLGLGLALSRSLAEAMGGTLAARRGSARGAELVLTLPRA